MKLTNVLSMMNWLILMKIKHLNEPTWNDFKKFIVWRSGKTTERDEIDSNRKDSPLKIAKGAIVMDNSEMNLEDQFHTILQLAKDRIAGRV